MAGSFRSTPSTFSIVTTRLLRWRVCGAKSSRAESWRKLSMSEMRLEPPTSAPSPPPPLPPPPGNPESHRGSLALGVGLAWLIMVGGEILLVMVGLGMGRLGALWLPPLAILAGGVVMLKGSHPRTGKGMLLGLLSIVAVLLLLVAACFGLVRGIDH